MADVMYEIPQNLGVGYQQLLTATAHLLLEDGETDELCQTIFAILREPLGLDVYFHYLVAADHMSLELASSGGNDQVRAALGSTLKFGEAVCGTAAERCEWMYVTHVQERIDSMTALIRSYGIRCYSCQPLISKGQVIGTFSVGSASRNFFSESELEVFRLVARQLTMATERKLQNRYIRQLEHQASAGRMAASIAHEINNPLESLMNLLFLVRMEPQSEEALKLLEMADGEIARLGGTVQNTLDLFRNKRHEPVRLELEPLLREAVDKTRKSRELPMVVDLEAGLFVEGVKAELMQVFINLLLNASYFSPADEAVSLSSGRRDGVAEIRVTDMGPGISEARQRRLFQPFYTTRVEKGTGLGLWVSHEIVERAGGSLTIDSHPELRPGSTFLVSLPISA